MNYVSAIVRPKKTDTETNEKSELVKLLHILLVFLTYSFVGLYEGEENEFSARELVSKEVVILSAIFYSLCSLVYS